MKKLIIQAFCFFGLSGIGWLIDMSIYSILVNFNVHTIIANIISSFVAVTFVYTTSTKKIFKNINEDFNVKKKYIVYIVYQILIILISSTLINILSNEIINCEISLIANYHRIFAKVFVTPLTMITNFIFMKFLIEKI